MTGSEMEQKLTPYLADLAGASPPIGAQYFRQQAEDGPGWSRFVDPLREDEHEVVPGLVHKYANRALIKVSLRCAAHCRFCTRYRQIGSASGDLTPEDIRGIGEYLAVHPAISDVILSGGDPLYTPKTTVRLLKLLRD